MVSWKAVPVPVFHAGLEIGVPFTSTSLIVERHVGLSAAKVIINGLSTVAPAAGISAGKAGTGMLNVLEVTEQQPVTVNTIVAPVTEAKLVAVNPVGVKFTGEVLVRDGVAPGPIVHAPEPTCA